MEYFKIGFFLYIALVNQQTRSSDTSGFVFLMNLIDCTSSLPQIATESILGKKVRILKAKKRLAEALFGLLNSFFAQNLVVKSWKKVQKITNE
ncbi:hypothetical protein H9X57_05845 [Flavobacterium piscinae]|uniref:hypothetical protein n=1 Tax=Flavobacterium piscinae TaxID=2506424 RepID=UPI0019C39713|nr:hypothetical protein [Flavobacterium piscinae]MBC8883090.1 hypothetical protein [Flavobacterium piscinae]